MSDVFSHRPTCMSVAAGGTIVTAVVRGGLTSMRTAVYAGETPAHPGGAGTRMFQRNRNIPERLWVAPAGMYPVSPLRKGWFTAETQRAQRKMPYRVIQTPCANAGAPEVPVTIWNRTFPGRNRVVPGRLESPATPGNRAGGDRRRVRAGDAAPPPRSGARARGSSPAPARPLRACGAARPPDRSADR